MLSKKSLSTKFEVELLQAGEFQRIIGIDEVGRGCWAGPVTVGGFVFDASSSHYRGVNDSKMVKKDNREKLYKKLKIHQHFIQWGSVEEIDKYGITKMIERLIENIIEIAGRENTLFIIDGQFSKDFGINTRKVIKADATYYCVAAASILAKVERDALMMQLGETYPGYQFGKHKGYGTQFHRDMIKELGPCEIHRKSYAPISILLS